MATARKAEALAEKWISLVAAAKLLGETRHSVLTRTVKGELEAEHIAGRTIVSRADVERILAERAK